MTKTETTTLAREFSSAKIERWMEAARRAGTSLTTWSAMAYDRASGDEIDPMQRLEAQHARARASQEGELRMLSLHYDVDAIARWAKKAEKSDDSFTGWMERACDALADEQAEAPGVPSLLDPLMKGEAHE
jgi:hypothetical protein